MAARWLALCALAALAVAGPAPRADRVQAHLHSPARVAHLNAAALPPRAGDVAAPMDMCLAIASELPSYCSCAPRPGGFVLACSVNFLNVDVIGLNATFLPCANPARLHIVVYETDDHLVYPSALHA